MSPDCVCAALGNREDYCGAGAGVGVGGLGTMMLFGLEKEAVTKGIGFSRGHESSCPVAWVLICRLIQPVGLEHDQGPGGRAQGVCVCVYTGVCVWIGECPWACLGPTSTVVEAADGNSVMFF